MGIADFFKSLHLRVGNRLAGEGRGLFSSGDRKAGELFQGVERSCRLEELEPWILEVTLCAGRRGTVGHRACFLPPMALFLTLALPRTAYDARMSA